MSPRSYICLLGILFICHTAYDAAAKNRKISLRKAIATRLVNVRAKARGGTGEKALILDVTSNSRDTLSINIEPALMFKPDDSTRQPLVTQGDEILVLNACEEKTIALDAYCGNSGAYCPKRGGRYTFSRQLDTTLVSVLRYAKSNDMPICLKQGAVWTFTNEHPLRSVYSPQYPVASENLIKYIAKKRKMDVPTYYSGYATDTSGQRPMVRRGEETLYVNMNWTAQQGSKKIYVSVYRADGTLHKRVENNIVSDKYGSAVVVRFDTRRDQAGKYIIRLHDDMNTTLQEKTVMLSMEPGM
ncbi:hypothetical protein GCM10023093_05770 [Nemorincola caseinilytica]|uniref:Uncharacterized protein n=1 Tax=Nemorincola caseinilytica TaxID=2054315 RepID=A0ABP8N8K0_9BACT